jgi:hypothetical protein
MLLSIQPVETINSIGKVSLKERILYNRYRESLSLLRIENETKYIRAKTKKVVERTIININYPTYTR